ncbi:MAG: glutaminyl-peptide cyclotransferase [Acidobacteria bacterium]|nr:MAG: glutaminyl-peptide cyclotransferase [Acidobacteriota bacterium]REJ99345.1 MAG: glutaminyl-peptide cyclotransferase [Acidobacteriota bacterium]REK16484.1 MAG: glutaminyl-peptide cyclotransferase [Acidobacteriota bacterium]REK44166.1 MAG: glutaminyl-peptide cyclotransferase [Acidobacteriota bacterium]
MKLLVTSFIAAFLFACNGAGSEGPAIVTSPSSGSSTLPSYGYDVIKTYPHDPRAFTQGLFFHDGFLYESTGQKGMSSLRKVEIESGKVLKKVDLDDEFFGEGIVLLGDKVFQLTWQSGIGFVYDLESFEKVREFRYSGEGWGLATDGKQLYHSDGTHVIRVVNPENYETVRTIVVKDENGRPLMSINELEWVKGEIWANIWHSERIGKPNHVARIDPKTGALAGWIDLGGISPDDIARNAENTLNGIAYDPAGDRIFVTGKNWSKMFEIKLKALAN